MFDAGERAIFLCDDFNIVTMDDELIEIESRATEQCWMIRKFDRKDPKYRKYPPLVLFHKHSQLDRYHVHFVYDKDNAFLAYLDIAKHEKYLLEREARRKRVTKMSNKQLLLAAMA